MLARELRVEAHVESRVKIDRARVTAPGQQAVELRAATSGAVSGELEGAAREVVRGEVERLESEHWCCKSRDCGDGRDGACSAANRRTGLSEDRAINRRR